MKQHGLVILGSGYTAKFVLPCAPTRYSDVFATSRVPETHLQDVPSDQRIRFDLRDPATWANIPARTDLLWCFPAEPLDAVKRFAATMVPSVHRLVVLGSTSGYDLGHERDYPPPWIDESTPLDLTKPRVQGEEYLRLDCGAMVLRVAGIYGPGRNPLEWIKTGRVGPSRKFVNLIHVEDLAAVCLTALERGTPGETYNVSDGTPRTWKDICDMAQTRWGVTSSKSALDTETGKRITNHKLTEALGYTIRHPDLYAELDRL